MRYTLLFCLAILVASPVRAEPDFAAAVKKDYDQRLAALFDWFHRHPELSYMETATAARMAKELRKVPGMVVTGKVGGTGVVGVLRNGEGPTVLVRADMDGLPIKEASGLANASTAVQVGTTGSIPGHARLRARHAHHRTAGDGDTHGSVEGGLERYFGFCRAACGRTYRRRTQDA